MDQFCLKWNNFQTSLVTAFSSLQSTEELADVTLTCAGQSIKAHKIILSACSPYFRSVFKDNPCSHPIVILKDVEFSELVAILNFMYHGEVLMTQDKLASFLQTAELLKVSGLVSNTGLHDVPLKYVHYNEQQTIKKTKKTCIKQDADKKFEAIVDTIKTIKTDVDSIGQLALSNNNTNENMDAYEKQSCLNVKDLKEPSILERSLTSQALQPNCEQTSFESDKQGVKHKHISEFNQITNIPQKTIKYEDDASNTSDETPVWPYAEVLQPHHSSQCGNCPHCGKVYSNQSALKYHVRLVHSDLTNMYCCHLCPEAFDFREGYKKHMADAHSVRN